MSCSSISSSGRLITAFNGFVLALGLLIPGITTYAQITEGTTPAKDVDSVYVRTFMRPNDIRLFYGGQGNRMVVGSLVDGKPDLPKNLFHNTNDYIGIGLTYKWLDGDLYFSLPGTTYLKGERSNLDQFRLSASHTRRKMAYRVYLCDSKGVILSGDEDEYQSDPAIHEFMLGVQATYVFNESKYSYRAALFQSERQMATAGSFLLRAELFYRNLGETETSWVPQQFDHPSRFEDQQGLRYLKAPGLLVMPGYGINIIPHNSCMFISPVLLAGIGAAFNTYKSNSGINTHANMEVRSSFLLNAGYNGSMFYSRVQCAYTVNYSPVRPTYISTTDLSVSLLIGYRFQNLKSYFQ